MKLGKDGLLPRPKAIRINKGYAKGAEADMNGRHGAHLDDDDGPIAEGSFWTFVPADLRRMSAWCLKAADYLDAHKKVTR